MKKPSTILLLPLCLGLMAAPLTRADTINQTATPIVIMSSASSSSGSSSGGNSANDFDSVCADILAKSTDGKNHSAELGGQFAIKLQYCQAAKTAKDAGSQNGLLWKVWAGVAGICTYACISSFMASPHMMLCTGANIGASVTDGVMTKNYMSSLMSLGTSVAGYAIYKSTKTDGKPGKDFGSCLSAATATMTTFSKKKAESAENDAMKSSLDAARAILALNTSGGSSTSSSSSSGGAAPVSVTPPNPQGPGGFDPGTNKPPTITSNDNPGNNLPGGSACAALGNPMHLAGAAMSAITSCALASDKTLPKFVSNPGFPSEIGKNTGLDPSKFFDGAKDPAAAILTSTGGAGLSPSDARLLANGLGDAERKFNSETGDSQYAATGGKSVLGGSGNSGAGGGIDPVMGEMMANLMKQLNPGAGGPEGGDGKGKGEPDVVEYRPDADRGPATLTYNPDDPAYSLFERVSYRYRLVNPRVAP